MSGITYLRRRDFLALPNGNVLAAKVGTLWRTLGAKYDLRSRRRSAGDAVGVFSFEHPAWPPPGTAGVILGLDRIYGPYPRVGVHQSSYTGFASCPW